MCCVPLVREKQYGFYNVDVLHLRLIAWLMLGGGVKLVRKASFPETKWSLNICTNTHTNTCWPIVGKVIWMDHECNDANVMFLTYTKISNL